MICSHPKCNNLNSPYNPYFCDKHLNTPMKKTKKRVTKKPDLIFVCQKCEHQVYVNKSKVMKILKNDCPECGEEPYENWILVGEGDFDNR